MAERREERPADRVGVWLGVVGVAVMFLLPAAAAQLWWRSRNMCGEGVGCGRAGLYVLAVGVVGALVVALGLRIARRRRRPKGWVSAVAILLVAVLQLVAATPTNATWSDRCNHVHGTTIRLLTVDGGPFELDDTPTMGFAYVTLVSCHEKSGAVWKLLR